MYVRHCAKFQLKQYTLVKNLPVASDKNPVQISFSQEVEFIEFRRAAFRHS